MKRLLLTLAALAATAGAPFADTAFAKDRGPGDRGPGGRWEAAQGRGHEGPRGGQRWERPSRGGYDGPRRDERSRRDDGPRHERREFDAPPPPRAVRPGGYLPPQYRGAPVEDYPRYRLRPPPEGYGWRRMGDAFVLMDRNGQVFDIIPD